MYPKVDNADVSREHHFVPEWYQWGFLPEGRTELLVLDKAPMRQVVCSDGTVRPIHRLREIVKGSPGGLFRLTDLYAINFPQVQPDVLERSLFGPLDNHGSRANRLFTQWPTSRGFGFNKDFPTNFGHPSHRMMDLVEFIDAQKTRTPKGVDLLKELLRLSGYENPDNNVLMGFLLTRRKALCTVWAEAVWEIFATDSPDHPFLLTDDPVVIYNSDCYPLSDPCRYPRDPDPFWRGSRVIYPLSRSRLLVLTHVEHADAPSRTKARRRRRNARSFDQAMINFEDVVNYRALSPSQVAVVNFVIKTRATRFVASESEEALYPERATAIPAWAEIDAIFHNADHVHHGSSEIIVKYTDGTIFHTNAFGEHDTIPGWFIKAREAMEQKKKN